VKALLTFLIIIFCALQYRVWFGSGSAQEVWRLREETKTKAAQLQELRSRNEALKAEVEDLKRGLDAIEERARAELGMLSKDETFYQFVRNRGRRGMTTTIVPSSSSKIDPPNAPSSKPGPTNTDSN